MADKVAILGTVPNSRAVVPYNDESWDVWCCSGGNSQSNAPPRITEWYEIHSIVDLHGQENQGWYPAYIEWLNKQSFPIWMQEPNEDVPHCKIFPYKPLMERFGPNKAKGLTNWFTSSIAWMFGFAIARGYKTIGVFGVDMAAAEEHYTGQKAGLLRWFEIGRSLGLKVIVPHESTLAFDYPLYGYAEASRIGRSMVIREIELLNRERQLAGSIEAQMRDLHYVRGCREQLVFDRRTYPTNDMMPEIDYNDDVDSVIAEIDAHLSPESRAALAKPVEQTQVFTPQIPADPFKIAPPSASDFDDPKITELFNKPVPPKRRRSKKAVNGPVASMEG